VLRLQVLAVGTSRNDIICFDRRDGTLNTIVVTQGHSAAVSGLALDPASPSFATAGDDKTLRCVERTPKLRLQQPHGSLWLAGCGACSARRLSPCAHCRRRAVLLRSHRKATRWSSGSAAAGCRCTTRTAYR